MEPPSRPPSSTIYAKSILDQTVIFDESNRHLNLSVSLPDIDDENMRAVFTYLEYYNQDIFWSFLSDSFFTLGGILYFFLSTWNLCRKSSSSSSSSLDSSDNSYHRFLEAAGPFVYVLNSIIDIQWAMHTQQRRKQRRALKIRLAESPSSHSACSSSTTSSFRRPQHAPPCQPLLLSTDESSLVSYKQWHKWTKYAAHRRTMLAASTFGIAALLALGSVYTGWIVLDIISAHVYIASAVIAITGRRNRPWFAPTAMTITTNTTIPITIPKDSTQQPDLPPPRMSIDDNYMVWFDSEVLEDLGDVLFFIGSLVDAGLTDLSLERPVLTVLQSLFWLIDACLYMLADIQMASQLRKQRQNNSSHPDGDDEGAPRVFV